MLGRDLKDFLVDIRLYQGLALSPFLIVSDEFTNKRNRMCGEVQ